MIDRQPCERCGRLSPVDPGKVLIVVTVGTLVCFALLMSWGSFAVMMS